MMKTKGRLVVTGLALVAAIAVTGYLAWPVPAKGFEFPAAADIASMKASFYSVSDDRESVIPNAFYDEILAGLSPSRFDWYPAKWVVLGALDIRTVSGKSIHVELYQLDKPVGAFAAGPTFESRECYRGGNSARLNNALRNAIAVSEGQRPDG